MECHSERFDEYVSLMTRLSRWVTLIVLSHFVATARG